MGDFVSRKLGSMPLQDEMVASFAGSGNEASEMDGEIIPYRAQSSCTNGFKCHQENQTLCKLSDD